MATAKSTALTNAQASPPLNTDARQSRGKRETAIDTIAAATGDLSQNDVLLFKLDLPTNAILTDVYLYNDDLDSNCAPAVVADIGFYALEKFTSTTSGTDTIHNADSALDVDALVDGTTALQAATTSWTKQALDATTAGPDDATKRIWEVLGYDEDPRTKVTLGVTIITAPATAAAGDVSLRADFLCD